MATQSDNEVYAALDLGSNSFHLLVASFSNNKLHIIDRHKDMVRFASGLDENDQLSPEAQDRALDSLRKIAERLRGIPTDHIRVVGTNTLRAAANAETFLEQAQAILGTTIDIISGTEEARLIYLGVASDFAPDDKRRLVLDIGGGSTELVTGHHHPDRMESLMMGCVSYGKRFFADGSITEKAFKRALRAARQELSPYVEEFQDQWEEAVGSSGTIRSIGKIVTLNGLTEDSQITPQSLEQLAEKMLQFDHVDKLSIEGLNSDRKPVFPSGLAILTALLGELNIDSLHVSGYAVREGIVHDLSGRLHHQDKREETINHLMNQYHVDISQAERVSQLALRWLESAHSALLTPENDAQRLLRWAACLHEIGLAIAHGGYHKHGAYILSNADMPGFSRQEQARLSFLVLNQRRKLKTLDNSYGLKPDWALASLFRLACIFHRRRQPRNVPNTIVLEPSKKGLKLCMAQAWYDANPLTAADLEDERDMLAAQGVDLKISLH